MAESTQIRIDCEVKTLLEDVRDKNSHLKTHSDSIKFLISYKQNTEQELKEIKVKADQDNYYRDEATSLETSRRYSEDITLGMDRKSSLKELADDLGLYDENRVIDFLFYHFYKTNTFYKDSLLYLVDLSKGKK